MREGRRKILRDDKEDENDDNKEGEKEREKAEVSIYDKNRKRSWSCLGARSSVPCGISSNDTSLLFFLLHLAYDK